MRLSQLLTTLLFLLAATPMVLATDVYITPGNGWTGPTIEPGPVGNPGASGYNAKVIGFFDVVPHQTFTGEMKIGAVAFHVNGIDRVEFAANGGPAATVREMTFNERVGVWEYCAVLDASSFPDGLVEVRAIAYPNVGRPRLLTYDYELNGLVANGAIQPVAELLHLPLWANSNGTLPSVSRVVNPGESIAAAAQSIAAAQGGNAGGGVIYLTAGDHAFVESGVPINHRWLTITNAPGTTRNQVRVSGGHGRGFANGLVELRNIKLVSTGLGGTGGMWANGVEMVGSGMTDANAVHTWWSGWTRGIFVTESIFSHLHQPIIRAFLQRNLVLDHIGQDLLRDAKVAINITAYAHGAPGTHPDTTDWWLPHFDAVENFLVYNLVSYDADPLTQGIYHGGGTARKNVAFVNVLLDRAGVSDGVSHWQVSTDHLLLWHVVHDNIRFVFSSNNISNLSVRGCVWWLCQVLPGVNYAYAFSDNHFIDTTSHAAFSGGVNASGGAAGFVNRSLNDYRPSFGSPLRNRIMNPAVPADFLQTARVVPASIGTFEFDSEGPNGDIDSDGDGVPNAQDGCPYDPLKTSPGACGCGSLDTDSDGDSVPDCADICPGFDDLLDGNGDGIPDDCEDDGPGCVTSVPIWQNQSLGATADVFTAEFDAAPLGSNIDGITGLSLDAGDQYDDYAVLIRFNNLGFIDVRDADVYRADQPVAYSAGQILHFRVEVDLTERRYSTWVRTSGGGGGEPAQEILLAQDYEFRSSQSNVSALTHAGVYAASGTHMVCSFEITDGVSCSGDVNGDGSVGFADTVTVLTSWGPCAQCPADVDDSGDVGFEDLAHVLGSQGPCQPCSNDLDDDGVVAFTDLTFLLSDWGLCDGCEADLDADGMVGFTDLVALLGDMGSCS
jgi:hypothetical protein